MFDTKEQLISEVQSSSNDSGVVMKTESSTWNNVVLSCVHVGKASKYLSTVPANKQRKSASIKTACDYKVKGGLRGDVWEIISITGSHDHPVQPDLSGYSRARRLTELEVSQADRLFAVGVPTRKVKNFFISEGNDTVTSRGLYNQRGKYEKGLLDGRTEMEALVHSLHENGYTYDVRLVFLSDLL